MATAKMVFGGIPGVDRPALAAVSNRVAPVAILSMSAPTSTANRKTWNSSRSWGKSTFAACVSAPASSSGLLSGKKKSKGNELTREAFQLLKRLPLNFIGNVEGRDIYSGDIMVTTIRRQCQLKDFGSMAKLLVRATLKETLKATIARQVGYLLSRSAFADFLKSGSTHGIRRRAAAGCARGVLHHSRVVKYECDQECAARRLRVRRAQHQRQDREGGGWTKASGADKHAVSATNHVGPDVLIWAGRGRRPRRGES